MSKRISNRWIVAAGVGLGALCLGLLAMVVIRSDRSRQMNTAVLNESLQGDLPKVYWETLSELDLETGEPSEGLKEFDDQAVMVPGFAVPLQDNLDSIREFLLVPNRMACIHAPPPPPNQMVLVNLAEPLPIADLMGPLWVTGQLDIVTTESKYGNASFEMKGNKVRPYTPD